MINYFVGELLSVHWDGACLHKSSHNHYIARSLEEGKSKAYVHTERRRSDV